MRQEPRALRYVSNYIVPGKRRNVKMAYVGIGPEEGIVVDDDQAYEYALERCLNGSQQDKQDFKDILVEWFFSGNWIREDDLCSGEI